VYLYIRAVQSPRYFNDEQTHSYENLTV